MSEWRETTLAMICSDISYGYTESAKQEKVGPKFLRITDIANGRLDWDSVPYCPITEEHFKKYQLLPGDIVIARTGATTGANYTIKENDPREVVYASYLIRYQIDKSVADPFFIGQLLRSPSWNDYVDAIAGGSAQPGANAKQLGSFEILLPSLPEQRAIAAVLSSLDDKIDLLHRQNQTLEQMAETLFRQWFVEEADEGWEWRQLDEFIDVQRGLSYKGKGLTDEGNGVPMHNLNSVFEGGGYKETGIKYYKGEFKERHKVFPGDVIVANTEQGHDHLLIGYPAIVPQNFGEFGIFSQHIYRLKIKSCLSNFFLFHLLKTHDVHEQIAGATNGSTVNMLPKDGVEWVKFRMPPQDMIDDFTLIAKDYYKKQQINQTQIRTLTALRDTLLPKLMSGEVRVSV